MPPSEVMETSVRKMTEHLVLLTQAKYKQLFQEITRRGPCGVTNSNSMTIDEINETLEHLKMTNDLIQESLKGLLLNVWPVHNNIQGVAQNMTMCCASASQVPSLAPKEDTSDSKKQQQDTTTTPNTPLNSFSNDTPGEIPFAHECEPCVIEVAAFGTSNGEGPQKWAPPAIPSLYGLSTNEVNKVSSAHQAICQSYFDLDKSMKVSSSMTNYPKYVGNLAPASKRVANDYRNKGWVILAFVYKVETFYLDPNDITIDSPLRGSNMYPVRRLRKYAVVGSRPDIKIIYPSHTCANTPSEGTIMINSTCSHVKSLHEVLPLTPEHITDPPIYTVLYPTYDSQEKKTTD